MEKNSISILSFWQFKTKFYFILLEKNRISFSQKVKKRKKRKQYVLILLYSIKISVETENGSAKN